jgi:hypothetical protein
MALLLLRQELGGVEESTQLVFVRPTVPTGVVAPLDASVFLVRLMSDRANAASSIASAASRADGAIAG